MVLARGVGSLLVVLVLGGCMSLPENSNREESRAIAVSDAEQTVEFRWADAKIVHDSSEKKAHGAEGREELLISQLAPHGPVNVALVGAPGAGTCPVWIRIHAESLTLDSLRQSARCEEQRHE